MLHCFNHRRQPPTPPSCKPWGTEATATQSLYVKRYNSGLVRDQASRRYSNRRTRPEPAGTQAVALGAGNTRAVLHCPNC